MEILSFRPGQTLGGNLAALLCKVLEGREYVFSILTFMYREEILCINLFIQLHQIAPCTKQPLAKWKNVCSSFREHALTNSSLIRPFPQGLGDG